KTGKAFIGWILRGFYPSPGREGAIDRASDLASSIILVALAGLLAFLQGAPAPVEWDPMSGTNRVAVSPFVLTGPGPRKSLGEEVARTSLLQIQADLSSITPPPTVW